MLRLRKRRSNRIFGNVIRFWLPFEFHVARTHGLNRILPMHKSERKRLRAAFEKRFGPGAAPRASVAPGRCNLIGEHTDYNGGLVLPIAVQFHTATLFRPNSSPRIAVYSETVAAHDEFDLKKIVPSNDRHRHWANYIRGV